MHGIDMGNINMIHKIVKSKIATMFLIMNIYNHTVLLYNKDIVTIQDVVPKDTCTEYNTSLELFQMYLPTKEGI